MKHYYLFLLVVIISCTPTNKKHESKFDAYIRFNHLYIVIDDPTYNFLFDSLQILNDFSYNNEQSVNTGEESWTGKYLIGRYQYLEIFNSKSDENLKFGDLGLGFMTDKFGIIDSIRQYWGNTKDSVVFINREFVNEGQSYPWYYSISSPDIDSLGVEVWLMENQKDEMISVGFSEEDLKRVISWTEYSDHRVATDMKTSPDSVKFEKAFSRITDIHLTLTEDEYVWLKKSLLDFGFTEVESRWVSQDVNIEYEIQQNEGFILNQIDFELMDSLKEGTYQYRNIKLIVKDNRAHLRFLYND